MKSVIVFPTDPETLYHAISLLSRKLSLSGKLEVLVVFPWDSTYNKNYYGVCSRMQNPNTSIRIFESLGDFNSEFINKVVDHANSKPVLMFTGMTEIVDDWDLS